MKIILIIIGIVLTIIGLIAGVATEIECTLYFCIPLVILFGAAGLAFFRGRIEGMIGGMIFGALLPVVLQQLFDSFKLALSTLP